MHDPLAPPPLARNPDTVFLLGLLLTAGAGQLASGAESGSVAALVPTWVATGWAALLTLASAVTLTGVWWRGLNGVLVELVGRTMLAPACLAYAAAIVGEVELAAPIPTGMILGLALSSAWRAAQIIRSVRGLRAELGRMTANHDDRDGE